MIDFKKIIKAQMKKHGIKTAGQLADAINFKAGRRIISQQCLDYFIHRGKTVNSLTLEKLFDFFEAEIKFNGVKK